MSGQDRSLAGNAARASVAGASTALLAVLVIIAGRFLGDAEYGKLSYALALAMIFETLVDLGLKEITTREVARERRAAPGIVAQTLGLKLALAATASIALVVTVRVLRAEPDVRLACYLLGAASLLRSYLLTFRHTLQGLERFGLDSTVVVVDRSLLLLLGLGSLSGGLGLLGLAWSFVAARVLSLSVAYALAAGQIGAVRPAFDFTAWRTLQLQALPFGVFTVVFYVYSHVDMVMLGEFRTDEETGHYGAAYRLYEGLCAVAQVLQAVLIPRLASQFVTDRAEHGRLSRAGLLLGAGLGASVGAGAIAFAGPLVALLFPDAAYAAAVRPLQLLASGFVVVFPLFVLYAVALSVDARAWLLRTAVIGCVANVALNRVLIPRHGMHGAAVATVVGEALSLAVLAWGLRRHLWQSSGRDNP